MRDVIVELYEACRRCMVSKVYSNGFVNVYWMCELNVCGVASDDDVFRKRALFGYQTSRDLALQRRSWRPQSLVDSA